MVINMIKQISIKEALDTSNSIFIDLRSESEYNSSNIPGSINIPILNDEERSTVGKIYKVSGEEAKIMGLRYSLPKLESIYKRVLDLSKQYKNIIIYCWRGGMRSKSVCNILSTLGIQNVYQLNGGYKSYRQYVLDYLNNLENKFTFVVLHGLTGVGKTIILQRLSELNEPVINLEDMAKNAGSVFGNILFSGDSPSQKQFESMVFNQLYYNKHNYIFIESESKRVGNINLPNSIMDSIASGKHILIETSLNNRINILYDSYIKSDNRNDDMIIKSLLHLKKRLGNNAIEILVNKVKQKEYKFVIQYLLEYYYDPLYKYSINKIKQYDLTVNYDNLDDCINQIKKFVDLNISQ